MKDKVLHFALSVLVFTYIIFEEIVWEMIAKPIYLYLHSLQILQKIEQKVHSLKPWMLLTIFLIIFIKVELLGILAGILLLKGSVITATTLYLAKIPIAAFAFWLFRISRDKLLSINWFKVSYDYIMKKIQQLKETQVYINIKYKSNQIKLQIKKLKQKYFPKGEMKRKIKKIYIQFKKIFQKTDI